MKHFLPSLFNSRTVTNVVRETTNSHLVTRNYIQLPSGVKLAIGAAIPNTARKSDRLAYLQDLVNYGFNQREAAELAGMSPSYASRLLNGK